MVTMMDGSESDLGPQVAPALFGYMLGVSCAVSSFIFGRHVYDWLKSLHTEPDGDVEYGTDRPSPPRRYEDQFADVGSCYSSGIDSQISMRIKEGWNVVSKLYKIKYGPLLFTLALFGVFGAVDAKQGIAFYRRMWMTCLLAPLGSVVRWRISVLNKHNLRWTGHLMWMPWGTLIANVLAAVISVIAEATNSRVLDPGARGYSWLSPALYAIEVGFAGSLSTVSTLIREMFSLDNSKQSHVYCLFTIFSGCLFGLLFYSPIIRYG